MNGGPRHHEPPWLGEDADLDDGGDAVRLPRIQGGRRTRPQHLILTLLGDYWFGRSEHLPSAALVALTAEFGVSTASSRTALSRLAGRGLITSSRAGRHTYYGLTPRTEEVMHRTRARIFSFGLPRAGAWDGTWVMVTFSVPQELRDVRHLLRTRLRWLGFAPLYDGVWVSATADADETAAAIGECGVEQAAVFRTEALFSTVDAGPPHHPLSAWDLPALRDMYEQFVRRFELVGERMAGGSIGASDALVERTAIMDTWRRFPGIDPDLPDEVLPAGWPRGRAQTLFAEVYDGLGPLAEARFTQILGRIEMDLIELVRHHTTTSFSRGPGP